MMHIITKCLFEDVQETEDSPNGDYEGDRTDFELTEYEMTNLKTLELTNRLHKD